MNGQECQNGQDEGQREDREGCDHLDTGQESQGHVEKINFDNNGKREKFSNKVKDMDMYINVVKANHMENNIRKNVKMNIPNHISKM